MTSHERARDRHYWIRSNITEDISAWEVGYLDQHGHWWVFGVSGWFDESELEEVGPELVPPAAGQLSGKGEEPA